MTTQSPRPLGIAIPPNPLSTPTRKDLPGKAITLTPLTPSHAAPLEEAACAPSNAWIWDYMLDTPPTPTSWAALIASKAASTDPLFWAIAPRSSPSSIAGYCSIMRIDAPNRVLEIGHILFAPTFQRSVGSTEAIYLLLSYAFDGLGYRRVEWKCNDLNAPSRRAAERFGFTYEGTFRQHLIVKGLNRDTAWYSMLDSEWPAVKAGFEKWLDAGNFDGEGKQIKGLVECREGKA